MRFAYFGMTGMLHEISEDFVSFSVWGRKSMCLLNLARQSIPHFHSESWDCEILFSTLKSITDLYFSLVLELEIVCCKIPGLHTSLLGLWHFLKVFVLHNQGGVLFYFLANIHFELWVFGKT